MLVSYILWYTDTHMMTSDMIDMITTENMDMRF